MRFTHCFKYLFENDCEYPKNLLIDVILQGRTEFLKYLNEKGFPLLEYYTILSAEHGHIECLEYLLDNKCQYNAYNLQLEGMSNRELFEFLKKYDNDIFYKHGDDW